MSLVSSPRLARAEGGAPCADVGPGDSGGARLDDLEGVVSCHEEAGRLRLARERLDELVTRLERVGGGDRAAALRVRLAELDARIPQVSIDLDGRADVETVLVDGRPLPRAALSVPVSLDPGDHAFRFEGRGRAPLDKRLSLRERDRVVLAVDPLRRLVPPPPPRPLARYSQPAATRRATGLVLLGLGGATLGAGAAFGGVALGERREADRLFALRSRDYLRLDADADRSLVTSAVSLGAGVALVVVGVALLATSGEHAWPR